MPNLYRRSVRRGDQIKINGNGAWVRIDVLAIEGTRVQLGFASSRDYQPLLKGQRIVAGGFKIQAMKLVGKRGVQLGIQFPKGFRVVPRSQTQSKQASSAEKGDPGVSSADVLKQENSGEYGENKQKECSK